ncbi:hypothetical protein B0H13DRAFT_1902950 [Mycena leptocephala]|nr:hypothetical protein B0H13DRAFT_1902950 [Mycena leptocephala]
MSNKSTSSGSNSTDSVTALDGLYYGAMVQMLRAPFGQDLTRTDPDFDSLFGVTILQTRIYINSSRKDRRLLRIFIGFLIGMDLTHTVAVMQLVHSYVITENFMNVPKLTAEISAYTILEGILMLFTTFAVQIFFASRVYICILSLNLLLRSKCRIPNRKLWDRHVQSGLCLQRSAFGSIGWLCDSSTVMELQEC